MNDHLILLSGVMLLLGSVLLNNHDCDDVHIVGLITNLSCVFQYLNWS